jgi:hypothetical protein
MSHVLAPGQSLMRPTVQWNGENAEQIEHLLRNHVARADKEGDRCRIRGIDGLNITLGLGDRLVIEGDRLGVLRSAKATADPTITWDATNLAAIVQFLAAYKVRFDVVFETLFIYGEGETQPAVLNKGDRLIERKGVVIVSKAGKDHRA